MDENKIKKELRNAFQDSLNILVDEIRKITPVDTGRLRNSIHIKEIQDKRDVLEGIVGTDVEYAPFVEYGTSRMAPRAMFRRGTGAAKPKIKKALKEALERALNG